MKLQGELTSGRKKLLEVCESTTEKGEKIGVSPSQVSLWQTGKRKPNRKFRAVISAVYGIDPHAWDETIPRDTKVNVYRARSGRKSKNLDPVENETNGDHSADPNEQTSDPPKRRKKREPPPKEPPHDATALDNARYMLACIRYDLRQEIGITARTKLRVEEARALKELRNAEREEELTEDRYVRDHPMFRRFCDRLLDALKPYPDVSRKVLEAMRDEGIEP